MNEPNVACAHWPAVLCERIDPPAMRNPPAASSTTSKGLVQPLALGLDVPVLVLRRAKALSLAPAYLADADDPDCPRPEATSSRQASMLGLSR